MDDLFAPRAAPDPQELERLPPGAVRPSPPPRRRRRVIGWAVAWLVGLLVAAGVGVGGFWLVNRGGDPGSKVVTRIPAEPSALPTGLTGDAPQTLEASTAPAPPPAQP